MNDIPMPASPADLLRSYMAEHKVTQAAVAGALRVSLLAVNQIMNVTTGGRQRRRVTAEMSLRLEKATGIPAVKWLGPQVSLDLYWARRDMVDDLKKVMPIVPPAAPADVA